MPNAGETVSALASAPARRGVASYIEVRFRDTDAMGHVNNAVYLTYLEIARNDYWFRVVGGSRPNDLAFIVARVECDFRSAVKFGDALEVRVHVSDIGRSSFTMRYTVFEALSERVVAIATTVQVSYDYETGCTRPLPETTRAAIAAFEAQSEAR